MHVKYLELHTYILYSKRVDRIFAYEEVTSDKTYFNIYFR